MLSLLLELPPEPPEPPELPEPPDEPAESSVTGSIAEACFGSFGWQAAATKTRETRTRFMAGTVAPTLRCYQRRGKGEP